MLALAYARSLRRLTTRCRFRSTTATTIPASTAWDEYISSLYAPYDPSPFLVIETAFAAVSLSNSDILLDLGAGDGRVVEAAAARCARALGVEKEDMAVAMFEARLEGVPNAELHRVNLDDTRRMVPLLAEASVVYSYLSPRGARAVLELLSRADASVGLRDDLRVVCVEFPLPLSSPGGDGSSDDSEGSDGSDGSEGSEGSEGSDGSDGSDGSEGSKSSESIAGIESSEGSEEDCEGGRLLNEQGKDGQGGGPEDSFPLTTASSDTRWEPRELVEHEKVLAVGMSIYTYHFGHSDHRTSSTISRDNDQVPTTATATATATTTHRSSLAIPQLGSNHPIGPLPVSERGGRGEGGGVGDMGDGEYEDTADAAVGAGSSPEEEEGRRRGRRRKRASWGSLGTTTSTT